jgi:hypothetical protein
MINNAVNSSLSKASMAPASPPYRFVSDYIQRAGIALVSSREPGGTPLGEKLRDLVLHEKMHLETEALLMFASRREHIAQVIEPALASGAGSSPTVSPMPASPIRAAAAACRWPSWMRWSSGCIRICSRT